MNNTQEKIGFLHIPRTGGTYIESILSSSLGPEKFINFFGTPESQMINRIGLIEKIDTDQNMQNKLLNLKNWPTCLLFSGHFSLNIQKFLPTNYHYNYITILRDPITRVYSFVKKVTTSKRFNTTLMDGANKIGDDIFWNNFIKYIDSNNTYGLSSHEINGFSNYITKVFSGSDLSKTITVNEELYNIAKFNLSKCKYIGIFENYESVMNSFTSLFNIQNPRYTIKESDNKFVSRAYLVDKLESLNEYDIRLYKEFNK